VGLCFSVPTDKVKSSYHNVDYRKESESHFQENVEKEGVISTGKAPYGVFLLIYITFNYPFYFR